MVAQFERILELNISTLRIQGMSTEFRVDRSLSRNPNTAEVTVRNLNAEHRAFLSQQRKPVVRIAAGYTGRDPTNSDANQPTIAGVVDKPLVIFLGEMREVTHMRDGTDWITRVTTGDGDSALKTPVQFSLGPGADIKTAIKRTVDQMGVGVGNAVTALQQGRFADAGDEFINGFVADGLGGDEIERLAASSGLEASIQNSDLQLLPIGKPLNNEVVVLRTGTGLVGSPELGVDKKTGKAVLKFRSLMNARLVPGAKTRLDAESTKGFFRLERVVYLGETHGPNWYVDGEASAL